MRTSLDERITRIVLGLGLVVCGYVFIMPLQFLAFYSGLMIVGFGIDPRGTEFPEDEPNSVESANRPNQLKQEMPSKEVASNTEVSVKKSPRKKKAQAS